MKAIVCILIMLTVTPIVAATGLVTFDPGNWGGSPTIAGILGIALFGLISVPLWFTFIPTLILTPFFMTKLSRQDGFHNLSIKKFIGLSVFYGALAGIFILSPPILFVFADPNLSGIEAMKLVANWAWAGALSGAATFLLISMMYRRFN